MMEESQKNTNPNKENKEANFFFHELNERATIRRKTKEFKNMIDSQKQEEINRIEKESNKRMDRMSNDITDLENAIEDLNPEKIKDALRKMQL